MGTALHRRTTGVLATFAVGFVAIAGAEREPVLKQIGVPHDYYYREMYLPQAQSGPTSPAWAPDGRSLVVAMQGSLWRIEPDTGIATQLTNGPGYDSQPDWSPDGRFIVYASYQGDAVELWRLEVASGTVAPLTRNAAVNLEPRFSPDGRRIAFVSTVFAGRFHLHVMDFNGGEAAPLLLAEDRDSGLPRYYYSRFDHEISPAWSPDGRDLLFVSNRGHIWGSGGFWRKRAEAGAEPREIRYEETNWRARPDWSRDGKRVVYSSYLGRNWNQLWLMTSEGGDVFPLTYGEFDATSPRFSPDSSRIAYISNEHGNTELMLLDLPGGRKQTVPIRKRIPLGRTATLEVQVVDERNGNPMPARLSVIGSDGRSYAPDGAWRHADDHFDRSERRIEYGYFHTRGLSTLRVPAGTLIIVEAARGLEYGMVRRTVTLAEGGLERLTLSLPRLDDLPARGWWSGDLHVHMNYGGAYRNDPKHLAFQAAAEDLHVVENLIVNKEQRVPDIGYFRGRGVDPVSNSSTIIAHTQEYHTSYWGHTALLGLSENILLPSYAAYVNTGAASLYPDNSKIFDLAHAQGALTGYVHPFDTYPDPSKLDEALTSALPVDVALGKLDYYEVVGFSDHRATARVWYQLLNCGFRIPAGAGTDAMANYASLRGPVGLNRVFVKSGPVLDHERFLAGLKAGKTFATNGPLLSFTLQEKEPGGEIRLSEPGALEAKVTLRSIVPVDTLEIVANGEVVASLPLSSDRTSSTQTLSIRVERSGWYTLRASAEHSRAPVLDLYPFATTSPIYVTVAKAPVRSTADARYFIAWIDRLTSAASAHTGWNSTAERDEVLGRLLQARKVFADRATP